LGRSAFGFLVVHPFQLEQSLQITRQRYEIDDEPYFVEEVEITLDTDTSVTMEGLSPKEMDDHMAFFLKVLPHHTTNAILTTPNSIT
jgi:hypothetical protein